MATKPGDTQAAKDVPKVAQDVNVEDVGDVPDPDEDDLDDLDDMLDDFSSVKIDSKEPVISAAGPGRPSTTAAPAPAPASKNISATAEDDVLSDDDFAKQLQAGMAELMGEMESSPEMQAQFESIFKELGAAAAATTGGSSTGAAAPGPGSADRPQISSPTGADASFQDTIRRTMERMQTSGDQATAAAQSEGSDDFMAELLKQMQAGGLGEGGLGEGSEEEFSKMLLGMMEQLTNKDILYEPMKELKDKFPEWMEKNKDTVSEEDMKRYELQQGFVKEIVAKFEETTYSDSNAADREYIVDRMQKMQAAGSPPPDLVGDMPSAQDALNAPDAESCNPQ